MNRRRPFCFPAALLALGALCAAPATAQDDELLWNARAETAEQARTEQEELYLTLFNTYKLPLRTIQAGDVGSIDAVLHREGVWIGPVSERMRVMICQLNLDICTQTAIYDTDLVNNGVAAHVEGISEGRDRRWTLAPDTRLVLPDLRIVQTAKPEPAEGEPAATPIIAIQRACLNADFCIDDYRLVDSPDLPPGALRRPAIGRFNVRGPAIRLVPHLNALVDLDGLEEAPMMQRGWQGPMRGLLVAPPDAAMLQQSIGKNLIGGIQLETESTMLVHHDGEPLMQRALLEWFCNLAEHGRCPILDDRAMPRMTVAIVDQLPQIAHCDFGTNIVAMDVDIRAGASAPATDGPDWALDDVAVPDCDTEMLAPHLVDPGLYHGTHVLGLLAARVNGHGAAGLLGDNPNTDFIAISFDTAQAQAGNARFLNALAEQVTRAVTWHNAQVVNFSFSYRLSADGGLDPIREVIETWKGKALFIAAAGKQGLNADDGYCATLPACYARGLENLIGVVGLEPDADRLILLHGPEAGNDAPVTNYGASVFQIGAMARDVVSTVGDHSFGALSGTSQAAPQVTAAAALLIQDRMRPEEIRRRLIYTARLSLEGMEMMRGGALDATAAIEHRFDRLRLADGCSLRGTAMALERPGDASDGGLHLSDDAIGIRIDKPFATLRRIWFEQPGDLEGIFFFEDEDRETRPLERYRAVYRLDTDAPLVRIRVSEAGPGCDGYELGQIARIPLRDVVNFISRSR